MMELKDIRNPIVFVDWTVNKAKIVLTNGKTKVISFVSDYDNYGRYKFTIKKEYEKYCVV